VFGNVNDLNGIAGSFGIFDRQFAPLAEYLV